jgi:hypothetical protein
MTTSSASETVGVPGSFVRSHYVWFKAMTLVFALAHIMLLIISPTMTRFLYAVLLVLYAQLFVAYISVVGSSWKYRSQIPLPVSILMVATGVSIMISFVVFNLAEDEGRVRCRPTGAEEEEVRPGTLHGGPAGSGG